jgi:hypothetical protein
VIDPSWRRIAPGAYDDGIGGLHIDASEILRANGFVDNEENRAALDRAAAVLAAENGIDYSPEGG